MPWKPVRRDAEEMIRWDSPKIIEGLYLGSEERSTRFGSNLVHFIQADDGRVIGFFGTAQLNSALTNLAGKIVRIEYTGKVARAQSGNVKVFEVAVWEDEEEV